MFSAPRSFVVPILAILRQRRRRQAAEMSEEAMCSLLRYTGVPLADVQIRDVTCLMFDHELTILMVDAYMIHDRGN
jgi:hypothetical protein